jgi:hypothetical protein
MARILAHDEEHAASLDELALVADPFHAGSNFHDALAASAEWSKAQQYRRISAGDTRGCAGDGQIGRRTNGKSGNCGVS